MPLKLVRDSNRNDDVSRACGFGLGKGEKGLGWRCVLIKQTPPDQEWKILQDMAVIFLINKMKHGEDGRLKNLVTSQVNATCDGLWPLT